VRSTSQKIPIGWQFCQLDRFIKPSGQQFYRRDHVFTTSSNQALLESPKIKRTLPPTARQALIMAVSSSVTALP
jgi:hypothetical protein